MGYKKFAILTNILLYLRSNRR